jgi:2-oxoglutarate dehydrogenase E2 component (dihydrolipoamide succinyltransferase)
MPQLGESVTEGTVIRWLKGEGEHVNADEPLLEVSTDKVDTEIPSPVSGIVRGISVSEDETVAVGTELAVIEEDSAVRADEQAAASATAEPKAASGEGSSEQWAPEPGQADETPPQVAKALEQAAAHRQDSGGQRVAEAQPGYHQGYQQPAGQSGGDEAPRQVPNDTDSPYVTPLVRKLAAEHGIDLSSVSGTGVGGRIRKKDVLDAVHAARNGAPSAASLGDGQAGLGQIAAGQVTPPQAAEQQMAAPAQAAAGAQVGAVSLPAQGPGQPRSAIVPSSLRGRTERMSRGRQVIASRMVKSLRTSAQLTSVLEADVTAITRLRERAKAAFEAREGVKLTFLPFFALAAVEALKVHPMLNAVIDAASAEVTYHDNEHLGIAVDTERGLMVPVIKNAGDLNIGGLARNIADLAGRTRAGQVSPDELSGGTFTLTNTGSRGALFDTPIINQPQVGILATGSVVKRAVVVDDPRLGELIAVRSMVYLALTYDHRLVDGADAARFLVTVKGRLEEGAFETEIGL